MILKIFYWSSCKVPVNFFQILMKLKFSGLVFSKSPERPNFMKIRLVGAELFMQTDGWADRRTDEEIHMTKLIVTFRKFASAPKNYE